eukprot:4554219-Prymnesium_polylepis.1
MAQRDVLEQIQARYEVKAEAADDECHTLAKYAMMERRLQGLIADDKARIEDIQLVKEECLTRVSQWLAVAKEGEVDLAQAEAELAQMRSEYKAERYQQRRMIGERRQLVNSMVKYTEDRQQRME